MNSKLCLMNTNPLSYQVLQTGQALALPARKPRSMVLVEGEVLLQPAARWLGGAMVTSQPRRAVAPEALDIEEGASVVALTRAKLAIEETRAPFTLFGFALNAQAA